MTTAMPSFAVAPPTTYRSASKVTAHGVQYYVNLPGDYSAAKKYFLCVAHSGAGPVTHRIWSSGDLCGYGEAVGFSPIYLAIDYGTDQPMPPAGDPLWARYAQALTDIQQEYPNTHQGIFTFGFSLGASFVSHYAQKGPLQPRIAAISPNSSGSMALPSSTERNYIKVLFTCGSRDGNLTGIQAALPVYQSQGYNARVYIEPGVGHEVGDSARYQTARFFKWVADSLLSAATINARSLRVKPATANSTHSANTLFMLTGRLLPGSGSHAPALVAIPGHSGQHSGSSVLLTHRNCVDAGRQAE